MSKLEPLTEQELASFRIPGEVLRYLEIQREKLGLSRDQINVLDYGCGKGTSVAWLREHGYNAFGVDVERRYIDNGRGLLRARGLEADSILSMLDEQGRASHDKGFFHFIFSEAVFEHVPDLQQVMRELGRLTASGGAGLHRFPAHLRPVEEHLFMPLVHYLPKTRARLLWIALNLAAGVGPRWPELETLGLVDQARAYYKYSVEQTFYRSPRAILSTAQAEGFRGAFVAHQHPKIDRHPVARRWVRVPGLRGFASWLLTNFVIVELLLERPDGKASVRQVSS